MKYASFKTQTLLVAVAIVLLGVGAILPVANAQTVTSVTFKGNQGPWAHVAPNGDAAAPTLAFSGLKTGDSIKATSIDGTWSGRLYHGQDLLPYACSQHTVGSFTTDSHVRVGDWVFLKDLLTNAVATPAGATQFYVHAYDSNYFDNSGARDNRFCTIAFVLNPAATPTPLPATPTPTPVPVTPACKDGIDNDGDGLVDMADPGCSSPTDTNEGDGTSQCQDGIDNDGDGAVDLADFSCQGNSQKNDETSPKAACQDGIDNDSDGLVDMADPGCSTRQDNDESNQVVAATTPTPTPTITSTCIDGNGNTIVVSNGSSQNCNVNTNTQTISLNINNSSNNSSTVVVPEVKAVKAPAPKPVPVTAKTGSEGALALVLSTLSGGTGLAYVVRKTLVG